MIKGIIIGIMTPRDPTTQPETTGTPALGQCEEARDSLPAGAV